MKRKALYTGSFDPLTYGHMDLIERALKIFDQVYVGVAVNIGKNPFFSLEERLEFLRETVGKIEGVSVEAFEGLSVDYAKSKGIRTIVRGVRATSDFDYEFQMALTNRKLADDIETMFLMPSEKFFYISSRLIKEVALLGGDLTHFVPPIVRKALQQKHRCS